MVIILPQRRDILPSTKTTTGSIRIIIHGEPVPYTRMTQKQLRLLRIPRHKIWSESALKVRGRIERIMQWRSYVEAHLYGIRYEPRPKAKTVFNVKVFFSSRRHGDPENVRKLLQDIIFSSDKYVTGSIDFDYDSANPRCEIEILQNLRGKA